MRTADLAAGIDLWQSGAGDRLEFELRRQQSVAGSFQIRVIQQRLMHQRVQCLGVKQLIPVLGRLAPYVTLLGEPQFDC